MADRLIVVIPTAGESVLLPQTLQSLSDCEIPDIFDSVIVVENGTAGQAEQAVQAASGKVPVEYLHVERANKSHALNQVFRQFDDDDLVYLVDDDVRFAVNCLAEFASASGHATGGHVFGGPLRIDSQSEPPAELAPFLPGSMKGWEPLPQEFDSSRDHFLGANWAVFAGDVRRAGGFDPRFGPGSPLGATGQEWTMQIALRRLGTQFVYLPNAIVWHQVDFTRFSRDFLLHRKYRGGLEAGIRAADFMQANPPLRHQLLRPALRARYRLAKNSLAAAVCQRLGWESTQLKYQLMAEHARGFLAGYPSAAE